MLFQLKIMRSDICQMQAKTKELNENYSKHNRIGIDINQRGPKAILAQIERNKQKNVLYGFSSGTLKGFTSSFNKQQILIERSIPLLHKEMIIGSSSTIEKSMKKMISLTSDVDNLIIYIYTHAIRRDGKEILQFAGNTEMSDELFTSLMIQHKAKRLVIFMETCYAGGILNPIEHLSNERDNILCFSTSTMNRRSWYNDILGGMATNFMFKSMPKAYTIEPQLVALALNRKPGLNQL